jgi:hypothetical protein
VISKPPVHKLLEIKLLQNTLYGRLSRRRHSCPKDVRGFGMNLV